MTAMTDTCRTVLAAEACLDWLNDNAPPGPMTADVFEATCGEYFATMSRDDRAVFDDLQDFASAVAVAEMLRHRA